MSELVDVGHNVPRPDAAARQTCSRHVYLRVPCLPTLALPHPEQNPSSAVRPMVDHAQGRLSKPKSRIWSKFRLRSSTKNGVALGPVWTTAKTEKLRAQGDDRARVLGYSELVVDLLTRLFYLLSLFSLSLSLLGLSLGRRPMLGPFLGLTGIEERRYVVERLRPEDLHSQLAPPTMLATALHGVKANVPCVLPPFQLVVLDIVRSLISRKRSLYFPLLLIDRCRDTDFFAPVPAV